MNKDIQKKLLEVKGVNEDTQHINCYLQEKIDRNRAKLDTAITYLELFKQKEKKWINERQDLQT